MGRFTKAGLGFLAGAVLTCITFAAIDKFVRPYEQMEIVIHKVGWWQCVDISTGEEFRFHNETLHDSRLYKDNGEWSIKGIDDEGNVRELGDSAQETLICIPG